nr:RNA-directed DNA polymerase, eukaryota [Tanacetum cinerariifolium]
MVETYALPYSEKVMEIHRMQLGEAVEQLRFCKSWLLNGCTRKRLKVVKTDSLPSRFNASRRGIDIDSIMCAICDNEAETSSHLFFSCRMVRQIVRMITRWWDVPYVEVDSYEGWTTWLVNLRLSSKHKHMLEGVFYVTWWHLWSFHNKLIFESKSPSQALFFDDVVSMSFYWCRNRCKASFSWNDWLKNTHLVSL